MIAFEDLGFFHRGFGKLFGINGGRKRMKNTQSVHDVLRLLYPAG
jgi:hypothetical protein